MKTATFVHTALLPSTRAHTHRHACARRARAPVATARQPGAGQNWSSNDWSAEQKVGTGHLRTIEFIIRPGGMVEETVSGVKGASCEKLTADIEEALGEVVDTEKTGEFYEGAHETVQNIVIDSVSGNKWPGGESYPTW